MFLAVVFYCTAPSIDSCIMMANVDNLWMTREECELDVISMANFLTSKGAYARWACFKVGKSV